MPTSAALQRSNRISRPPDRYGFSAILADITVPTSYSRATKQYVGRKLSKKNFKLFKRTILGILFPVLLVLKPLVVNGSIPLS